MDSNMENLLETLNSLRQTRWKILLQAQQLDHDLKAVAEAITATIISLYERYGQTWLEYDTEGRREREESRHFPIVLLESRRFTIEPNPAA